MTPLLPTSTLGTVYRKWQQHWPAACGAGLIFILASGLAIGWGAAAGRLTTAGRGPETSGARAILSAPSVADRRPDDPLAPTGASLADVFDGWYNDATVAPPWPVGTTSRHVADRWDNEPAAATTNAAGRGGFRAPDLPNGAAPNELQLFGR